MAHILGHLRSYIIRTIYVACEATPQLPDRLWTFDTAFLCGSSYIVITLEDNGPDVARASCLEQEEDNVLVIRSIRAHVLWRRLQGYLQLTPIFRQMRKEWQRDPDLVEFFAFLQLPSTYNWRHPSAEETGQIERWKRGLDDTRPKLPLYQRTLWLMDEIERAQQSHRHSSPGELPRLQSVGMPSEAPSLLLSTNGGASEAPQPTTNGGAPKVPTMELSGFNGSV